MLFAKKSKGFCVEIGEHTTLLARLSSSEAPIVVEEVKELPSSDLEAIAAWTKGAQGRGASGYAHATCGVYPAKRVVRRHTLDLKRIKDPTYFNEIYSQQFRIEPDKYTMRALNPEDGSEYDLGKGTQKEALFCGLPSDDVIALQDKLLEEGIYPERLELGTLATLGGIASYLQFKQSKSPVLVLEIGDETTQSFIVSADGVDISRPIPSGIAAMIPVVQKELGLKDEESARKLFFSNTFDFTGMGPLLVKKLLKELQSSIGFYEVQTGQSVGQVLCLSLPAKLAWLETAIASALGVATLPLDLLPWLRSRQITLPENVVSGPINAQWLGLFGLMASYNAASDAAVPEKKE